MSLLGLIKRAQPRSVIRSTFFNDAMGAVRVAFGRLGEARDDGLKGVKDAFAVGDPQGDFDAVNKRSLNADITTVAQPVINAAEAKRAEAETEANRAKQEADRAKQEADRASTNADRAFIASLADVQPAIDAKVSTLETSIDNKLKNAERKVIALGLSGAFK